MWALITLDLHGAESKRPDFDEAMNDQGFAKVPDVTTAWTAVASHIGEDKFYHDIQVKVDRAAQVAGIDEYDAVVQIGHNRVRSFAK